MALIYAASDHKLLKDGAPLYDLDLDAKKWSFDAKNVRFHHIDKIYDVMYEELENLQDQIDAETAASMYTWIVTGTSGSKTLNNGETLAITSNGVITAVVGGTDSAPTLTLGLNAKLIADLTDTTTQTVTGVVDLVVGSRSTWASVAPTSPNGADWASNLNTKTYFIGYDPVNGKWAPINGWFMVNYTADNNLYKYNGYLSSNRTVGFAGRDLTFRDQAVTDVLGTTGSATGGNFYIYPGTGKKFHVWTDDHIRLSQTQIYSNAGFHRVQLGFYDDVESLSSARTDRDIILAFYNEAGAAGTYDVDGGRITMQSGAAGNLVIERRGATSGDLVLQNANGGGSNKFILKRTGDVQINEYGNGSYTGTPTRRLAVDTDGNVIEVPVIDAMILQASDETTALTIGAGKYTMRMPFACTLTGIRASLSTAPVGSEFIADVNLNGSTIMTTHKLKFDDGEKTTVTYSGTAATLTTTAVASDDEITIDIDQVGSGTAGAGLKVTLYYTRST